MCQHTRSSLLGKAEFAQSVLSSELRKIEPVNQTRKTKNWSCPSAKNPVSSPVLQGHQTIVYRARGAIHVGDSLVMTSFEGWYIRLDLAKLGSRTELYFDPHHYIQRIKTGFSINSELTNSAQSQGQWITPCGGNFAVCYWKCVIYS